MVRLLAGWLVGWLVAWLLRSLLCSLLCPDTRHERKGSVRSVESNPRFVLLTYVHKVLVNE